MKTAFFISCLLVSGSMMLRSHSSEPSSVTIYKTTKARRSFSPQPIQPVRIVINKSSYELSVYDAQGWYATYPVVFGNSSLNDKKMEGDRNTPEGSFKIVNKRPHEKWDRFMMLDYPNKETYEKFSEWKKRGIIPSSARPGGGIGIHGTWPHEDFVVDRYNNWTNGCISLKREDVEDLYTYVPVGTSVVIKR